MASNEAAKKPTWEWEFGDVTGERKRITPSQPWWRWWGKGEEGLSRFPRSSFCVKAKLIRRSEGKKTFVHNDARFLHFFPGKWRESDACWNVQKNQSPCKIWNPFC